MGKVTVTLMVITIISKMTGFLREALFANFFGTSDIQDIYVVSQTVAAISFSFLFLSIQSTFIPMYNNIYERHGRKDADRFTSNLTNSMILVATGIVALFYIFMPAIIKMVAVGFTGEKFEQAVLFSRIVVFQIYFSAINGSMIGYLNNMGNFITPATTGIIMNMVLVVFAYLAARTGNMYILALGSVCSMGLQYIFFPRALKKTGYKHAFILQPKHPHIRESLSIAIPAMFSVLVNDISIIIDKSIATGLVPVGGASALNYANTLFMLIQGVVIVSIITASYPKMTRLAQKQDSNPFKNIINQSLISGLVLVIPACVGLMIFVKPIVRLFFQSGQFSELSTEMTAGALFWYAPGLIALMFSQVFIRAFYAKNDTKIPLVLSAVQVLLDVILNFVLSILFGLNGLAASTMLGNVAGALLLGLALRKKMGSLGLSYTIKNCLKICLASAIMGLSTKFIFDALTPFISEGPRLIIVVFLAALIYAIAILFCKLDPVVKTLNKFYHKRLKKLNRKG